MAYVLPHQSIKKIPHKHVYKIHLIKAIPQGLQTSQAHGTGKVQGPCGADIGSVCRQCQPELPSPRCLQPKTVNFPAESHLLK